MYWYTIFFFVLSLCKICYSEVIAVYADVYKSREFFTRTYPWIIENIGGELTIEYYLLGSGRYSVPQMCALRQLYHNTFVQSQYLQCEAERQSADKCLCDAGIDQDEFRKCVLSGGSLAKYASLRYSQLRIDANPVIEIGWKSTVFEVTDEWYLKKICTIFGEDLPRGCTVPFTCCNGTQPAYTEMGITNFDCSNVEYDVPNYTTSVTPYTEVNRA